MARVQSYDMGNGFDPVSEILFTASKVTFSLGLPLDIRQAFDWASSV